MLPYVNLKKYITVVYFKEVIVKVNFISKCLQKGVFLFKNWSIDKKVMI